MASGTIENYNLGEDVTIAGLAVQLAFFSVFIVTCGIFHRRIRQWPTQEVTVISARLREQKRPGWETVLAGLYAASLLILVRSIFRIIEYAQGNDGYLISHDHERVPSFDDSGWVSEGERCGDESSRV